MKLNKKLQLATFFISIFILTACGGGGDSTTPNPVTPAVTAPLVPRITPQVTTPVTTPAVTTPVVTTPVVTTPVVTTPVVTTPAVTTPPPTSQVLTGSWTSQCQASTSKTAYDEQDIFTFNGNKLTTNKMFYTKGTKCNHKDEVQRVRITSTIALGATVNPDTATVYTKIDITPTKVFLAPMTTALTSSFNNTGYTGNGSIYYGYGQTVWDRYYSKDISSVEAARKNFKINDLVTDIYQISTVTVDGTTDSERVLKLGSQGGNVDSDGRPILIATNIIAYRQQTTTANTTQDAGLTGTWKYPCRKGKGDTFYRQQKWLVFDGNKLKTFINFYGYHTTAAQECRGDRAYQVEIESDIVPGNKIVTAQNHTYFKIGIKTTSVKIRVTGDSFVLRSFNTTDPVGSPLNFYEGGGQTDWSKNAWKNISQFPNAIEGLNIGTERPDIFKITTVTDGGKELKMGDYYRIFDVYGRPLLLEPESAVLQ